MGAGKAREGGGGKIVLRFKSRSALARLVEWEAACPPKVLLESARRALP